MLQYPSILGSAKAPLGKPCFAFYKYDGSNLRFEWSKKSGWSKFGTRRQLFDARTPVFGEAIQLFNDSLGSEIVYRAGQFRKNPERITAFAEWFGPGSFAGNHLEGETKELRLFDVFIFKMGFIEPKRFVELFGSLPQAAELIYEGNLTQQLIFDIKKGKFKHKGTPLFEGVVAKGKDWSVKIKTDEYFRHLRHKFPERWEEYGE